VEDSVRVKISSLGASPTDLRSVAKEIVAEHGRFAEPILNGLLAKTGDSGLKIRLQQIISLARAGKSTDAKSVARHN
jgi:hypothetical protein